MKTLTILTLAVLLSNISLQGENKVDNASEKTSAKQKIAFNLAAQDITKNTDYNQVAEIERKDVSKIAFRTNIQQVTESALSINPDELNTQATVSFRLNVKDVFKNINPDQAIYELAVAEVAFKLNIHDVMKSLANTDASVLDNNRQTITFALNAAQVEKYAKSIDVSELVMEQALYAENK